jgi:hypothetical protein
VFLPISLEIETVTPSILAVSDSDLGDLAVYLTRQPTTRKGMFQTTFHTGKDRRRENFD